MFNHPIQTIKLTVRRLVANRVSLKIDPYVDLWMILYNFCQTPSKRFLFCEPYPRYLDRSMFSSVRKHVTKKSYHKPPDYTIMFRFWSIQYTILYNTRKKMLRITQYDVNMTCYRISTVIFDSNCRHSKMLRWLTRLRCRAQICLEMAQDVYFDEKTSLAKF